MKATVVRSTRSQLAAIDRAKHPIPERPAEETRPGRGRYEAASMEVQRVLHLLKTQSLDEAQMRAATIRMAKVKRELTTLADDVAALQLLGDEIASLVIDRMS